MAGFQIDKQQANEWCFFDHALQGLTSLPARYAREKLIDFPLWLCYPKK